MVRMRKLAVVVALAALAALTLSSCDVNEAAYTGNPAGKKVAIIGDQMTSASISAIHAALDPTFQVRIIALEYRTAAGLQAAADTLAPTNPDVVIIDAGTNDMTDPSISLNTTLVQLFTMAGKFTTTPCVVVTNMN